MQTNIASDHAPRSRWPHLFNGRFSAILIVATVVGASYGLWHKLAGKGENLDAYQIASVPRDHIDIDTQVSAQSKKTHVEIGSIVEGRLAQLRQSRLNNAIDIVKAAGGGWQRGIDYTNATTAEQPR